MVAAEPGPGGLADEVEEGPLLEADRVGPLELADPPPGLGEEAGVDRRPDRAGVGERGEEREGIHGGPASLDSGTVPDRPADRDGIRPVLADLAGA